MSEQSSLPGFDDAKKQATDLIFLAVLPDVTAMPEIQRLTRQIIAQHGLTGRPTTDGRLHISLMELGEHAGLPASLLDAISRAAGTVSQPAFDVAFDQVEIHAGTGKSKPCLLSESTRSNGFAALKDSLAQALKQQGVWRRKSPVPHITLLYDGKAVSKQPVGPAAWKVTEFVLLHRPLSEKGKPYNVLARWPLT